MGVVETDKKKNETEAKVSETVTVNDKEEETSKEVIVLENGAVEITEVTETCNDQKLADNTEEVNENHEEVTYKVTTQEVPVEADSHVTDED